MSGRSAEMTESDFEFSGGESLLSNETTCCGNLSGLCEWIEPRNSKKLSHRRVHENPGISEDLPRG